MPHVTKIRQNAGNRLKTEWSSPTRSISGQKLYKPRDTRDVAQTLYNISTIRRSMKDELGSPGPHCIFPLQVHDHCRSWQGNHP